MRKRIVLAETEKELVSRLAAGQSPAEIGGDDALVVWRLIVAVRRHLDYYGRERAGWSTVEAVDRWYSSMRSLSLRELEVALWAAAGLSNREIGRELVISSQTVQQHMLKVLSKTGLGNRTELAVCAVVWGWVDGGWCMTQIEKRRRRPISGEW
jgi:DNA-binding CsgD family transcriptional regulator